MSDSKNTKTNTSVVTDKEDATTKELTQIRQVFWALLGFKMAVEKLRELKFKVEVVASPENDTTIKISFVQLKFDFDSCTINGKDLVVAIEEITKQIESEEKK